MKLLDNLFCENNEVSLTRVLSTSSWLFFVIVTAYLVYQGKTWGNYDMFAMLTAGGGIAGQIGNKFINSKYNSIIGSYERKGEIK